MPKDMKNVPLSTDDLNDIVGEALDLWMARVARKEWDFNDENPVLPLKVGSYRAFEMAAKAWLLRKGVMQMSTKDKELSWEIEQVHEQFEEMAAELERAASEIRVIAVRLKIDGDVTRAAEVMSIITNMISNLRLDLLVRRPLRAAGKF